MMKLSIAISFIIFPISEVIITILMNIYANSSKLTIVKRSVVICSIQEIKLSFSLKYFAARLFLDLSSKIANLIQLRADDMYFYNILLINFVDIWSCKTNAIIIDV